MCLADGENKPTLILQTCPLMEPELIPSILHFTQKNIAVVARQVMVILVKTRSSLVEMNSNVPDKVPQVSPNEGDFSMATLICTSQLTGKKAPSVFWSCFPQDGFQMVQSRCCATPLLREYEEVSTLVA